MSICLSILCDIASIQGQVWKKNVLKKISNSDLSGSNNLFWKSESKFSLIQNNLIGKVHIFWEGHKNMTKSPKKFWRCLLNSKKDWRFRHLFVAPSQNIWTLKKLWRFRIFSFRIGCWIRWVLFYSLDKLKPKTKIFFVGVNENSVTFLYTLNRGDTKIF